MTSWDAAEITNSSFVFLGMGLVKSFICFLGGEDRGDSPDGCLGCSGTPLDDLSQPVLWFCVRPKEAVVPH